MTSSWGKNEDEIASAHHVRGPMQVKEILAGWVVLAEMDPDVPLDEQFTREQLALLGQSGQRMAAIRFEGESEAGDTFDQIVMLDRDKLATFFAETLATYMTRELWLGLKSILPEEMTR